MRAELMDCEATLLREIQSPEMKRRDVALTYALAIRSGEAVDWATVNHAIIARWSRSALEYIKRLAWQRFTKPIGAAPEEER